MRVQRLQTSYFKLPTRAGPLMERTASLHLHQHRGSERVATTTSQPRSPLPAPAGYDVQAEKDI
jgi:hypothetical protein